MTCKEIARLRAMLTALDIDHTFFTTCRGFYLNTVNWLVSCPSAYGDKNNDLLDLYCLDDGEALGCLTAQEAYEIIAVIEGI